MADLDLNSLDPRVLAKKLQELGSHQPFPWIRYRDLPWSTGQSIELIRAGKLKARKLGKIVLICRESALELIEGASDWTPPSARGAA